MPLVLGGVELDHPRGLAGHSDGDVLAHALIDALLGAAGLGDIGALFPSGDERLRGVSSLALLAEAYAQVRDGRLAARQRRLRARRRGAADRAAPRRDAPAPAGSGRRGRGQRPRDDDRPARLHRPRRGARRARRRAARAAPTSRRRQRDGAAGDRDEPVARERRHRLVVVRRAPAATARSASARRWRNDPSNARLLARRLVAPAARRARRRERADAAARHAREADRRAEVEQRLGARAASKLSPVRSCTRRTFVSTGRTSRAEGEVGDRRAPCSGPTPGKLGEVVRPAVLGDGPRRARWRLTARRL